ncbi:MAG: alpha/beta hydrolase [Acidimicrobiales bacterium]|nr:alpha/beta hydrolase [Acidimicrobiales bacterium]
MVKSDLSTRVYEGDPPLVVTVHGAMDRGKSFSLARRYLLKYEFLTYDRRGYGDSRKLDPPVAKGLEGHLSDLMQIIGSRKVVLVGHSYGGVIALTASSKFPRSVLSAVIYEAPMPWLDWWHQEGATPGTKVTQAPSPEEAVNGFMKTMLGDRWDQMSEKNRIDRLDEGPALISDLSELRSGAPFNPKDIAIPVTVGYGAKSSPRHEKAAIYLGNTIPDSQVIKFEKSGHGAHISHPREFAKLIQEGINRATKP